MLGELTGSLSPPPVPVLLFDEIEKPSDVSNVLAGSGSMTAAYRVPKVVTVIQEHRVIMTSNLRLTVPASENLHRKPISTMPSHSHGGAARPLQPEFLQPRG